MVIKPVASSLLLWTYLKTTLLVQYNQIEEMSLDAVEFIRRFLLHVLPSGFVKIRHFGFLSNRNRKVIIQYCRELLPRSPATSSWWNHTNHSVRLQSGYLHVIDYGRPATSAETTFHQVQAVDS